MAAANACDSLTYGRLSRFGVDTSAASVERTTYGLCSLQSTHDFVERSFLRGQDGEIVS